MGFPPTDKRRSSFCPGTRCGCASAVLLRSPSVNTGIEFWPDNFWPCPGRLPPKSCGSHFCSAENLGWLLSLCAGATLCTVSIAVYICLEPLAMGTSRPSGPSGVFWASSTCRHVCAHEDRVHHDSGHGDKFHEIDPPVHVVLPVALFYGDLVSDALVMTKFWQAQHYQYFTLNALAILAGLVTTSVIGSAGMGSASEAVQPIRGCTAVLTFLHVIPLYCFFFAFWQFADAKFATYKSDAFDRRLRDKGLTALMASSIIGETFGEAMLSSFVQLYAALRHGPLQWPSLLACSAARPKASSGGGGQLASPLQAALISFSQLCTKLMPRWLKVPPTPQEIAACVAMDLLELRNTWFPGETAVPHWLQLYMSELHPERPGLKGLDSWPCRLRFCWVWSHLASPSPRSISGPAEDIWIGATFLWNLPDSKLFVCL